MPTSPANLPFEGEALFFGGFRGVSWPVVVGALNRTDWIVGPYVEVVAFTPRVSRRGLTLRRTSVGTAARFNLPPDWSTGEPAAIKWFSEGRWRELYWEDRGLRLHADIRRARSIGVRLPRRWLEPAVNGTPTPGFVSGRLTLARLKVEAAPDDTLAPLGGQRRGLLFSSTVRPPESNALTRARRLLFGQPEPAPEAV